MNSQIGVNHQTMFSLRSPAVKHKTCRNIITRCQSSSEKKFDRQPGFHTTRRCSLAFTFTALGWSSREVRAEGLKELLVEQALRNYQPENFLAGSNSNQMNVDTSGMSPVQTLPSGVRFRDVNLGEGEVPVTGDLVVLQVVVTTRSGADIIDTRRDKDPLTLTLGILPAEICEGLEDGVRGMRAGGRRLLDVPAELAYGNALGPLRFDVEMLRYVYMEDGSLSCCPDSAFPCDKASPDTKGVITLKFNEQKEIPLSSAFTNLDFYLNENTSLETYVD